MNLHKLLKVKLFLNKANKNLKFQLPKKKFDKGIRSKMNTAKYAFIKFEGFE